MLFQVAFKVFLMYLSGLEKGIKALAGSRLSSACAREYTDSVRVRLYILKLRNPIKTGYWMSQYYLGVFCSSFCVI